MSDSQSEYSDDFLGIPPSEEPLSSGEQSDRTVEEEEEDETQPENNDPITVRRGGRPEPRPKPKPDRRKQTRPKRKNRVIKNIIHLQKTTNLLIPRLPFQRLVREIMHTYQPDFRLQSTTLEALQESTEMFVVAFIEDAYLCCMHCSRKTLMPKDMKLIGVLRR